MWPWRMQGLTAKSENQQVFQLSITIANISSQKSLQFVILKLGGYFNLSTRSRTAEVGVGPWMRTADVGVGQRMRTAEVEVAQLMRMAKVGIGESSTSVDIGV